MKVGRTRAVGAVRARRSGRPPSRGSGCASRPRQKCALPSMEMRVERARRSAQRHLVGGVAAARRGRPAPGRRGRRAARAPPGGAAAPRSSVAAGRSPQPHRRRRRDLGSVRVGAQQRRSGSAPSRRCAPCAGTSPAARRGRSRPRGRRCRGSPASAASPRLIRSESWWSSSSTTTRADPRQRDEGVLGVGGHQVGEVRRAERRRQSQVHLDDRAVRRPSTRADEAEVGDRLVELGVHARRPARGVRRLAERRRRGVRVTVVVRPTPGRRPLGSRGPVAGSSASASCSSAGTSMSYILAALRPRIFFFCSVVSGAYSVMSSGIWKSTNFSTSHFGVQIA